MEAGSLALAGRVLVGLLFIVIGARLLMARHPVAELLAAKRVPQPLAVAVLGGVFEIVAGLLAIAGVALPTVFAAMALFVIAATAMAHDFWRQSGPARAAELNTTLSHGLIVGGLLVMAVYPW